ncbi:hypothetical protein [Prosthecobacter sp.]|uniref:hypothetical protein n=1 Tax=Prosthecobacter sp. TaxID=1965333 RepID=UPI001DAE9A7D|nr:hypothetical protein [Prosthecobacter sp.]MCB1277464.1 hypothetical protein [Prosthecobacter sp.]
MHHHFPTIVSLLFIASCSILPGRKVAYPQGGAGKSPEVEIHITGHVKNGGKYRVSRTLREPLSELINRAGGFSPMMPEFASEKTSTVAWIERTLPGRHAQLIILDYLNKQIFSQRMLGNGMCRNERYHWEDFEFIKGDDLFVTTSRNSLDLAGWAVRWVEPKGWHGIERLRLFGMTKEETESFERDRRSSAKH